MKRILLAGVAAACLAAPAFAQSTTVTTGVAPAGVAVKIAPAERTRIHTYVTEHKVKPVTVKERVTVGATLPADIELAPVPSDWGPDLGRYRYVYTGNDIVLVEPSSRRVIEVID